MRRWLLISAAAAALLSLVAAYLVTRTDEVGSTAGAAAEVATVAATSPVPSPSLPAVPPPSLPAVAPTAAIPTETGDASFDQMVKELTRDSDEQIRAQIAAIDEDIANRRLVERANSDELSASERAALGELLKRRDALNVVKTKRLVVALRAKRANEAADASAPGGQP
jgi:hypothetical protein